MLREQTSEPPLESLEPVTTADEVRARDRRGARVYVEDSVNRYVVALLRHTRADARLHLGASPRAGIALLRVAKARALADGRDYVLPDDVKALAVPVLTHRLILAPEPRSAGVTAEDAGPRRTGPHACPGVTARGRLTLALGLPPRTSAAWLPSGRARSTPRRRARAAVALGAALWVRAARPAGRATRRAGRDGSSRATTSRSSSRRADARRLRPAVLLVTEHLGRLGEHRCALHPRTAARAGRYALRRPPRPLRLHGRAATVEDPFGLARGESPCPDGGALLVHPRLVELAGLFTESGRSSARGRRLLLRRPSGFDLHGVRELPAGRVAAPRALAVDGQARRADGQGPRGRPARRARDRARRRAGAAAGPSFDVQVRAAARSCGHSPGAAAARCSPSTRAQPEYHRVPPRRDWQAAYDALAAVEPDGASRVAALLAGGASPARAGGSSSSS